MAIDHPDRVWRLAVLYIVPTYKIYTETDRGIAEDYITFFSSSRPTIPNG